ncbi:MAG: tRNA (adenosine(37)-N6)-threonylcarbamoyltransferase complex ATPase subunit type 1 TsaE [Sandaracinaceae bacterium]
MELELPNRRATLRLAAALAGLVEIGDVIWLEGELGAGKTFLARGLLRALGVPSRVPVTSPTFALVHEHEARMPIRHLDLYRLTSPDELDELGLAELFEGALVVVEWGARWRDAILPRGLEIRLQPRAGGAGRVAFLRGIDERGRKLVDALAPPGQAR